jgi:hypothetical protein
MMKLIRLLNWLWRGLRRSYGGWKIDECYRRDPEHVYHCAVCGVSNIPCEHWKAMLDAEPSVPKGGVMQGNNLNEAMERMSRDDRFRATIYAVNTLLVQKGIYSPEEFEFQFCQFAQRHESAEASGRANVEAGNTPDPTNSSTDPFSKLSRLLRALGK